MKNDLEDQIESHVRLRKVMSARPLIRQYLREHAQIPEALFKACDWYRRLGLVREGFSLVHFTQALGKRVSTNSFEGVRTLWAARFLMMMGSARFALALARSLDAQTSVEWRVLGSIYLANFEYTSALKAYSRMQELSSSPPSYSERLGLIEMADALAGIGQSHAALKLVDHVEKLSTENLLIGICRQARGEYLARARDFDQALSELLRAKHHFRPGDTTLDYGFLCKWLGYVLFKLGKKKQGQTYLQEAERLLIRGRVRAETALDLQRLRGDLGLLSKSQSARLRFYPELHENFIAQLPTLVAHRFGRTRAQLVVYIQGGEYQWQGQRHLGLPKELELLGWLVVAGPLGINRERLLSILWPTEIYAYLQLESRLDQLVRRLRQFYNFEVSSQKRTLYLQPKHFDEICVMAGPSRPTFFKGRKVFRARELGSYYALEKTQSSKKLKNWIEKGWIHPVGLGRATHYRIVRE